MRRVRVESSALTSVGFDAATAVLELDADSLSALFNAHLKDTYPTAER